ncbi:hypothetical protein K437DRAFT_174478 [Tilletiaria anomala UBC 951]|uniref:Uncharacterized protein n=1 Tax=Tilletiaria anomala (strain ATCC 24038 / CBS 436.72 / UBC 951) TaxID=1037660 RepID=A0A066WNQ3_TILAU|nr:uncharacterized protein K437DRAFT_174478 [Tilletiaria anomala UBC 951]KDN52634.1 hypothetical protein K437DRAFT_174478 [Tilletiaria anomala UBC 951]
MSSTLDTSASSLASALLHLVPSHDQLLEVDGAKLHINLDYSVGSFPWARLSLNGQNYQEEQAPVRRKRPCTPTDTSPGIMQGNESLTTPVAPSPDDWTAGGASQISENVCSTHMASKEEPHLRLAGGVDEFTNCKRRFRSPSSRLLGLTPVFSSLNGSSGAATQHAMSSLRASTVPSPPRISPTSVPDEPSWYSFGTEATTQGAWRDQSDSSSHLRIGSRDDLNPGYHLPSQSQQSNLSGMHSQSSWLGLYGLTARSSTPSLFNREHVEAASAVHGVSLQSAHTIGPFRSIQPPTACKPKGLSDTETSPRSMPITELTPPLSSPRLLYGSMQSSVSLSSPLGTSGSRLGNSFVYPDPMSFQAASHGRTKAFPTNESSQQVAYTYENTRATAMGQPWTLSNSQDGTEHSSAPVTPTLHQADCKSMRLRNMLSPRDGYASDIDERDDHRDSDSAMTSPYAILAQSNGQSYFAHPWGSTQQSLLGYSDTSPSKSIGSLSKSSTRRLSRMSTGRRE